MWRDFPHSMLSLHWERETNCSSSHLSGELFIGCLAWLPWSLIVGSGGGTSIGRIAEIRFQSEVRHPLLEILRKSLVFSPSDNSPQPSENISLVQIGGIQTLIEICATGVHAEFCCPSLRLKMTTSGNGSYVPFLNFEIQNISKVWDRWK